MAGMVGSRNGWAEAAYAPCPASPASLAARCSPVTDRVSIVPGVIARRQSGPDVMRGEETLIFGTEVDGRARLPAGHPFEMGEGRGWRDRRLRHLHDGRELRPLSPSEPPRRALPRSRRTSRALTRGLPPRPTRRASSTGCSRRAPASSTARWTGRAVGPYLSGLLVGTEVDRRFRRYGERDSITLVAEGVIAAHYVAALRARGITAEIITPEAAFLAGLSAIAAARREDGGAHDARRRAR